MGGDSGVLLTAGLLALVVAALTNLNVPGTGVVADGLGTNALAVLFNRSTPVGPRALDATGISTFDPTPTQHLAGPDTLLPLLGGAIPVPVPGLVVSFGDLTPATGADGRPHDPPSDRGARRSRGPSAPGRTRTERREEHPQRLGVI